MVSHSIFVTIATNDYRCSEASIGTLDSEFAVKEQLQISTHSKLWLCAK